MAELKSLAGQRFGRLVVTNDHKSIDRRTVWLCQCDCGQAKYINASSLRRGLTSSCGCLSSETTANRNRSHGGNTRENRKPEYTVWFLMRQRCENPATKSYPRYGGRGITVCERWHDFGSFIADMGDRPTPEHTLERIDNDGPYARDNCRWATRREQANNTRRNRHLTFNGQTHTVAEWARLVGLDMQVLSARVNTLGWSVERALTTPLLRQGRKT